MSVYKKLLEARVKLANSELKKSGYNGHTKHKYYELGDFLPKINEINNELGLFSVIDFEKENAVITIFDIDKPDEKIVSHSPMVEVSVKSAQAIQNVGAMETYQRRYLYMNMYEISENDAIDSQKPVKTKTKETLMPSSDKWKSAVIYIKSGSGTIGQIESKYNISDIDKNALIAEAAKDA